MSAEQRRLRVEGAYDELGSGFGEWAAKIAAKPSARFLSELRDRLPKGARVLDLGCGDGTKELEFRAETAFLWVLARKPQ